MPLQIIQSEFILGSLSEDFINKGGVYLKLEVKQSSIICQQFDKLHVWCRDEDDFFPDTK